MRVGTALAVIVPEGAESFYEMRAHAEDANKVGAEHVGRSGGSCAHCRGVRCPL